MAKRFTDSLKWDDPWFMDLEPTHKLFWIYLLDNCDHAGVWEVNHKLLTFKTGINFDLSEIIDSFTDRIHVINPKYWFVLKFIDFQYNGLKSDPVGNSIERILIK